MIKFYFITGLEKPGLFKGSDKNNNCRPVIASFEVKLMLVTVLHLSHFPIFENSKNKTVTGHNNLQLAL